MRFFSICTASRRFRECQNASGGNASEISFRESGTREQITVSSPCHVDEILSCWDESWESFIETRKTHQFPGISDRSILQRQQHHCAQSHWRWRMKTPFNNIAYSGASAPVQTFFTVARWSIAFARTGPAVKTAPVLGRSIYCGHPCVFRIPRDFPRNNLSWKQQRR